METENRQEQEFYDRGPFHEDRDSPPWVIIAMVVVFSAVILIVWGILEIVDVIKMKRK
jgi:hypothetical protein